MNISRAIKDRRGNIISNVSVGRVSDAEQMDSIFFSADEKQNGIVEKVNELLEAQGLEVVENQIKIVPSNGNFRSFIGQKDYRRPETVLE